MNDQPTPASADDAGRILLVDDEATNLDILRETLEAVIGWPRTTDVFVTSE